MVAPGPRGRWIASILPQPDACDKVTSKGETKMKFHVPDMSCGHCQQAIETALGKLDTAAEVSVDLERL